MPSLLPRCPRLLAVALCVISAHVCAASLKTVLPPGAASPAALAAQIDAQIRAPRFAGAHWGIAVVSLDSGRTLYAHNASQLLQPASTAKLYTAALTLSSVGASYRIPTRLLASGTLRQGRLNGSLILYGMGDPTLGTVNTSQDWADQLAMQLAARGVRHVHGDLLADDTYFAGPLIGSGWEAGDMESWFAVPSSALSVQENIVRLTVSPAARAGAPAILSTDPAGNLPPLDSRLITAPAHARTDINLYRAPGGHTLYAFGVIAERAPAQDFKLSVVDPAEIAGNQLLLAMARHGIRLDGTLHTLHWPDDDSALRAQAVPMAEVLSPPVGEILRRGLKRSQNLYLQNLLLTAGIQAQALAAQAAAPADGFLTSEAWGMRALRSLLDRIGIPAGASLLQEGTGLSRQDLTTADAMVRLLSFLAAQPYAPLLQDALPLAGVDGSLIGRMRGTAAEGNIHAKTGSMNYVHALAGYVTTAAGERLAFDIMLNNYAPADNAPGASRDIDTIAVMLANYRGPRESQLSRPAGP
jgi:D-alanyl-D-alanine carboxypeptidase/D-alanyl-D-alanine-endopeptidase (penicillin-binding protein 4)